MQRFDEFFVRRSLTSRRGSAGRKPFDAIKSINRFACRGPRLLVPHTSTAAGDGPGCDRHPNRRRRTDISGRCLHSPPFSMLHQND
jgi:hypothetical protein